MPCPLPAALALLLAASGAGAAEKPEGAPKKKAGDPYASSRYRSKAADEPRTYRWPAAPASGYFIPADDEAEPSGTAAKKKARRESSRYISQSEDLGRAYKWTADGEPVSAKPRKAEKDAADGAGGAAAASPRKKLELKAYGQRKLGEDRPAPRPRPAPPPAAAPAPDPGHLPDAGPPPGDMGPAPDAGPPAEDSAPGAQAE
ncbi:MAG: hypothetical protein HY554_06080 [Elusimicrobia bacterium]|nr:hypothetical protein [Elusimicrobiota bacterium]